MNRPALGLRAAGLLALAVTFLFLGARPALAASEAEIVLPDFSGITMLGMPATTLLWIGVLICAAGIVFSLVMSNKL